VFEKLKSWARILKREVLAVYIAARDERVPWGVKLLALATAAYALSPIDLIPDFIPVIGYLDDLILLPLAVWLIVRLMPRGLMVVFRAEAERRFASAKPVSRWAAVAVVAIWLFCGAATWWWIPQIGKV
jgi:uncharacterized membrane protein YkvA (DUF1232 family)